MGFSAGLTRWRSLLKDGGHLIVSELCWFESPLPDELRTYWEANYPAISTEEERIRDAGRAGFDIIRTQRLPLQAWDDYYQQMNPTINQWKEEHDPEMATFLLEMEEEIRIFREYGSFYGYTFFILKKSDQA
ncbi:hypothetical protein [Methanocalculus sp.]|uniref:hypothetical protein n=1 Tax=Methanocalculus sp. TaxID=2004547 RepID=UPI00271B36AF|nr:hypothetical protein [Methanocalculus sp.]MDO8840943.1 hypothetical protein [Methanocalculus sp.]